MYCTRPATVVYREMIQYAYNNGEWLLYMLHAPHMNHSQSQRLEPVAACDMVLSKSPRSSQYRAGHGQPRPSAACSALPSAIVPQPVRLQPQALGALGRHIAFAVEEGLARRALHDFAQLERVEYLVVLAKLADEAARLADLRVDTSQIRPARATGLAHHSFIQ